jgi:hypothetical protein
MVRRRLATAANPCLRDRARRRPRRLRLRRCRARLRHPRRRRGPMVAPAPISQRCRPRSPKVWPASPGGRRPRRWRATWLTPMPPAVPRSRRRPNGLYEKGSGPTPARSGVPRHAHEMRWVDADLGQRPLILLIKRAIKQQFGIGRAVQPAVGGNFALELPGAPAGVTEG